MHQNKKSNLDLIGFGSLSHALFLGSVKEDAFVFFLRLIISIRLILCFSDSSSFFPTRELTESQVPHIHIQMWGNRWNKERQTQEWMITTEKGCLVVDMNETVAQHSSVSDITVKYNYLTPFVHIMLWISWLYWNDFGNLTCFNSINERIIIKIHTFFNL